LADEPTASLDKQSGQKVMDIFDQLARNGSAVALVTHDRRIIEQADRILMLDEGRLVPATDRIMKDVSSSLQTLLGLDPARLGRMMSFGHALAQVALADGSADRTEREVMASAIEKGKIFSGTEVELIVNLAIAQAQAWRDANRSDAERSNLAEALEAVAAADDVITEEERAMIRELLQNDD